MDHQTTPPALSGPLTPPAAESGPQVPRPARQAEAPLSYSLARWLSIGCMVTLAVVALAFAAFAVLIARGLLGQNSP